MLLLLLIKKMIYLQKEAKILNFPQVMNDYITLEEFFDHLFICYSLIICQIFILFDH